MVMGGLMQLIAYGAQEVYWRPNQNQAQAQEWVGYNQGFKRKTKANHRVRFFYKNVKNRNNTQAPIDKTKRPIQPYTNPEPGYVYTSSVKIYPAQPAQVTPVVPKRKGPTQKQRAINNFGWRKIGKFEVFFKEKLRFDRMSNQIVNFSSCKNTWSNKHKLINLCQNIKPIITKKLKTRPSLKYPVYFNAQLNNLFATNPIESLHRVTSKHAKIIKQTDISVHIAKRELKNQECPITLNEITSQYIQCHICLTTYDYCEDIIQWYKSNPRCAYCTNSMRKPIQPIDLYYNQIYEKLKN